MKKQICFAIIFLMSNKCALAQTFTSADTLRGMLTPLRTCYDVTYYNLDITVDPETKIVSGTNTIQFKVVADFDKMQIDLVQNMKINKIMFGDELLPYEHEHDAVFIQFPKKLKTGNIEAIQVFYSGEPQSAKRPPWDGGFVWSKDENGNPWVAVTVQGDGAYLWWPNKEHQSDEPDSMLLNVTVPKGLMNISNGRLRMKAELSNGWTRWDWFISYPINNYNVTLNIGKYAHFDDIYINDAGGALTLDYYVMPFNLEKAKKQFQEVKPMLACFEKFFGKFPFYRDGYKMVESPHLGMEHQTAIAYGNKYRFGYKGTGSSEVGITFDFIIIHETAHEWWGNSVTSKDIADMWIHESFGAYAEALYIECRDGYEAGLKYQNGKRQDVRNNSPIIGYYDVNHRGSGDMYPKGSLFLNTLRHVIDNDSLWFAIVLGIAEEFKYQTITTDDIVAFVNLKTGQDFTYMFDQYLKQTAIPKLEINVTQKGNEVTARYRWKADVADFKMPIKVTASKNKFEFIYPTPDWQTTELSGIHPDDFKVAEDLFYVDVKLKRVYLQEGIE